MMYSFVSEPMLCEIPYVCTLASAHTLNLSVCIHIFKYIYHVIDTFVYEPMLCELTYGCYAKGPCKRLIQNAFQVRNQASAKVFFRVR